MMKKYLTMIVIGIIVCFPLKAYEILVLKIKGDVKKEVNGKWVPLKERSVLHEGDKIKTGTDGKVLLGTDDGGRYCLGYNSTLEIKKADLFKKRGIETALSRLKLPRGKLRSRLKNIKVRKIELKIETPTAVAGVRGTDFVTDVDNTGNTTVAVFDGTVAVESITGEETEVTAGEIANITESGITEMPLTPEQEQKIKRGVSITSEEEEGEKGPKEKEGPKPLGPQPKPLNQPPGQAGPLAKPPTQGPKPIGAPGPTPGGQSSPAPGGKPQVQGPKPPVGAPLPPGGAQAQTPPPPPPQGPAGPGPAGEEPQGPQAQGEVGPPPAEAPETAQVEETPQSEESNEVEAPAPESPAPEVETPEDVDNAVDTLTENVEENTPEPSEEPPTDSEEQAGALPGPPPVPCE